MATQKELVEALKRAHNIIESALNNRPTPNWFLDAEELLNKDRNLTTLAVDAANPLENKLRGEVEAFVKMPRH